jgi:hypothetical protein
MSENVLAHQMLNLISSSSDLLVALTALSLLDQVLCIQHNRYFFSDHFITSTISLYPYDLYFVTLDFIHFFVLI